MRGAELVLGGLLLVAGIAAPAADAPVPVDGPFDGVARFAEAAYSGAARVDAPGAALRATGPVQAVVTGAFTLEILDETLRGVDGDAGAVTWHYRTGSVSRTTHVTYENAVLRVIGERDNVFSAWPNESLPGADFDLTLRGDRDGVIFPSWSTTTWATPEGRYAHFMEAPLFALGHDGTQSPTFELADTEFEYLRATGGLQAFVEGDATLVVEHAGGVDTYRTAAWEGKAVGTETVRITPQESGSYGVVTFENAELAMGFDGVDAVFISRTGTWTLNGSLAFRAIEGQLHAGDGDRNVTGAAVDVVGNTTLHVNAEGLGTTARYLELVATPSLVPLGEPTAGATFTGDADAISVNGERLPAGPAAGVPEAATAFAKLVGAAVVAWSIGRRLVLLALAFARKDPLADPRRRMIHGFLQRAGLAHVREIERATHIPVASLTHHLGVLRRAGVVQSVQHANRRVFFLPSAEWTRDEMRRLAALAHPTRRNLAQTINASGPLGQHELQERLGMSRATVSQQLAPLVDTGLLEKHGVRDAEYRAAPLLRDWILALTAAERDLAGHARLPEPEEV